VPARVYLAGWTGVYRSDDSGASRVPINEALPGEHADAVVVSPGPPDILHVIAGGQLWGSLDAGHHWRVRHVGGPTGRVEAVAQDGSDPLRVWALVGGHLFRSDDRGEGWRAIGRPLPEPDMRERGMAVVGQMAPCGSPSPPRSARRGSSAGSSPGTLCRPRAGAAEGNVAPFGVAVDAQGTVWATLQSAHKLVRISPRGAMTELELPTRHSGPGDVAVDQAPHPWL
jgi:hypothetical protein